MLNRLRVLLRRFWQRQSITPEMEANRCAISARDCEESIEYLNAYLELGERESDSATSEFFSHRKGLLTAAIVTYSRAFTISRGEAYAASMLKVNLGEVFNHDRSRINLHKLILDRRNKAVAHSDWTYHKTELLEATEEKGVLRKIPVVLYGRGIDIEAFRSIAEVMRDHFRAEMYHRDITGAR